jgi:hypothetical protein
MKKFFQKIGAWISDKVLDVYDLAEERAGIAVKSVSALKKVVEDPSLNLVVAMTNTDLDDRYLSKAQLVLSKASAKVAVAHGIIKDTDTPLQAIDAVVSHLRSVNKDARRGWWIELSAEVLGILMDGKVTFPELVGLTQMVFRKLFPNKK